MVDIMIKIAKYIETRINEWYDAHSVPLMVIDEVVDVNDMELILE